MDVREKLALQKVVRLNLERIKSADLRIKEKFAIQKETREALLKLGKGVKASANEEKPSLVDILSKALSEKYSVQVFKGVGESVSLSFEVSTDISIVAAYFKEKHPEYAGKVGFIQNTADQMNASANWVVNVEGVETPVFDALANGDFDNLDLSAYIEKLRVAFDEIQEIAKLIPHAERYADKAPDSVEKMQEALSDLETKGAVEKMEEDADSKKEEDKESQKEEEKEGEEGEKKEKEEKKVKKEDDKESKAKEKKEGKDGEEKEKEKEKKEKIMTESFDAEEPGLEPMIESVRNKNDIVETKSGETFKPYIPEVAFEQ